MTRSGFLMLLGLLLGAAVVATGVGIRKSKPWGFDLGIVIGALLMFGGNGFTAFGVALAVFCVWRRVVG